MNNLFLIFLLIVVAYYMILFLIGKIVKNDRIVKFGWSFGFVLLIIVAVFAMQPLNLSAYIVAVLMFVWGVRQSYHIGMKTMMQNKKEQGKEQDKTSGLSTFFNVYLVQAGLMYLVATPLIVVFEWGSNFIGIPAIIGIGLFLIGFLFETISDLQFKNFFNYPRNKGRIMRTGLWYYSRHPNYFGEVLVWWGVFLIVLSSSNGILAVISPILITYLLLFVTGIPVVEKKLMEKEEYKDYVRVTSKFFPLPKKKIK